MYPNLVANSSRLREWAIEQALPLWATNGFDAASGRFREALSLDGRPLIDAPTRLIVQSRQIYSYALALRNGWFPSALSIVENAYAALVRDYYQPDGKPGWTFSVLDDGRIGDPRRDLYSHGFALLAISSYMQATGHREPIALVDETLEFLDMELRAPLSGGYLEAMPLAGGPRRQNPHMHLFEAFLSLWTSTRDGRFLARAGEMFALFTSRFFNPISGTLGEYFDEALQPAVGVAGTIVEPGHHSEWIWLLRWFERETGRAVHAYTEALYAHVAKHGYDAAGLMVDELLTDGTHRTPSHRTWPMTEAIKANIAEATAGRTGAETRAAELAGVLFDQFLSIGYPGGWVDRLDARGRPAADTIPASTLYHVLCAVDELDRFIHTPETKI